MIANGDSWLMRRLYCLLNSHDFAYNRNETARARTGRMKCRCCDAVRRLP